MRGRYSMCLMPRTTRRVDLTLVCSCRWESDYPVAVTAIRTIDMRLIDDLFGMGGGYVLDFSDRTFGAFFREEIGVNIDDAKYAAEGTSKAKRLRFFLKVSDPKTTIKVLEALWEYRETNRRRQRAEESYPCGNRVRGFDRTAGRQAPDACVGSESAGPAEDRTAYRARAA
jgi:hypothetical protein